MSGLSDTESELKQAATNLVRHVHDSKFDGIILSGGSNAVAKTLLYSAWRAEYPDEKVPPTIDIPSEGNALFYKNYKDEETELSKEASIEWINNHLPELWDYKDKKVCMVDDVSASGKKANQVYELFNQLGFKNFEMALFAAEPNAELDEKFFVGIRDRELVARLMATDARVQGFQWIDDTELPEGSEKEIRSRGLDDLRDIVREIRK